MYPSFYWRNGEAPDRQGINEIRYVTGLYDYFDTLLRDHPDLLTDNCASGGRRIDFEMLRRALVLTRSDYLWDPIGQQCHTYGLAQWIPITGIGAADVNPYNCRSGLGSHFAFAFKVFSDDEKMWELAKKALNEHAELKHLYTGNFHPLGSYSIAKDAWMAWQFDRPDLGQGLVQAFRRQESNDAAATYKPRDLKPNATYTVTDMDQNKPYRVTGRELMEKGLTFDLPHAPSAAIVTYREDKK
jgi:alpha-galactosidase